TAVPVDCRAVDVRVVALLRLGVLDELDSTAGRVSRRRGRRGAGRQDVGERIVVAHPAVPGKVLVETVGRHRPVVESVPADPEPLDVIVDAPLEVLDDVGVPNDRGSGGAPPPGRRRLTAPPEGR